MNNELVELHPAFIFDCPECGRENMLRATVVEKEQYERLGIEDDATSPFGYLSIPSRVVCWACDAEFGTEHSGQTTSDE